MTKEEQIEMLRTRLEDKKDELGNLIDKREKLERNPEENGREIEELKSLEESKLNEILDVKADLDALLEPTLFETIKERANETLSSLNDKTEEATRALAAAAIGITALHEASVFQANTDIEQPFNQTYVEEQRPSSPNEIGYEVLKEVVGKKKEDEELQEKKEIAEEAGRPMEHEEHSKAEKFGDIFKSSKEEMDRKEEQKKQQEMLGKEEEQERKR